MSDPRRADGLRVDRVHFSRGNRLIIDDLDCTVPAGAVGALLGPNGAGKSTLLHLIAGIERADAGAARFGERDLATMRRRERARVIALAEQEVADAPGLTVAEVVALGRTPHLGAFAGPSGRDRAIVARGLEVAAVMRRPSAYSVKYAMLRPSGSPGSKAGPSGRRERRRPGKAVRAL